MIIMNVCLCGSGNGVQIRKGKVRKKQKWGNKSGETKVGKEKWGGRVRRKSGENGGECLCGKQRG